jgi:hypothetical protein
VVEVEDARQGPGKWAKIDIPVLKSLMRLVVNDRGAADAIGRGARQHILDHYDQTVVVSQVLDRLQAGCRNEAARRMQPKPRPTPPPAVQAFKW